MCAVSVTVQRPPIPPPRRRTGWSAAPIRRHRERWPGTTTAAAVIAHDHGPLLVYGGPGTGKTSLPGRVRCGAGRRRRRPVRHPRADLRPPRRGRAARPDRGRARRRAGPDHRRAAGAHLPRVRVRPAPPGRGRARRADRRGCSPAPSRTWSSANCWPPATRPTGRRRSAGAAHPGVRRPSCVTCCCAPPSGASARAGLAEIGAASTAGRTGSRRPGSWPNTTRSWRCATRPAGPASGYDNAEIVRAAAALLRRRSGSCWPPSAAGCRTSTSTSSPTPTRPRSTCCTWSPAAARTWSRSPIRTPRPTASAAPTRRGVAAFPDRFRAPSGAPGAGRHADRARTAPAGAAAGRDPAGRRPAARPGPAPGARCRPTAWRRGDVAVHTFRSAASESAYVAHRLREAHLIDGVPWDRMAVAGQVDRAAAARRCAARCTRPACRPRRSPTTCRWRRSRPSSRCCCCCAARSIRTGSTRTPRSRCCTRRSVAPIRSPSAGCARSCARWPPPRAIGAPSGDLLVEALHASRPSWPRCGAAWSAPAYAVAGALAAGPGRDRAARAPRIEDVLWALWRRPGWPSAGRRRAPAAAPAARPPTATSTPSSRCSRPRPRFVDRLPGARAEVFLDHVLGQELPGDSLAPTADRGAAVRILTAHAAKGLEWDVVVVAGVQEGIWPDLRLRGSVLGAERLVDVSPAASARRPDRPSRPAPASRRGRQRRRRDRGAARRGAAAVLRRGDPGPAAARGDRRALRRRRGAAVPVPRRAASRPIRTVRRRARADPAAPRADARRAGRRAAGGADRSRSPRPRAPARRGAQLRRLADAGVPGADPDEWWGLRELSDARPLVDDGEQVVVTPSTVEVVQRCSLRWLLERHGGRDAPSPEQGVGNLVHDAAMLADGRGTSTGPSWSAYVTGRFGEIELSARWLADRERGRAEQMIDKLVSWLVRQPAAPVRDRARVPGADRRERPGQGPGRPAGDRRGRPARGDRPQDRQDHQRPHRRDHRTPAARRVPGGGRGGRVRRRRHESAAARRWCSSAPSHVGAAGAGPARAVRGRGPGLGQRAGPRDGQDDGRVHVPRRGQREVPQLPGAARLPGVRAGPPGDRRLDRSRRRQSPDDADHDARPPPGPGSPRPSWPTCCGLRARPTPEQAAIIAAPVAPLLVVAGAGSGKTETMAARVVWLVANEYVRPEQILGLTFTRKAAGELASRIRQRLGAARPQARQPGRRRPASRPSRPTTRTPPGSSPSTACAAGYEPTARLLTEASCWQIADAVVRSYAGDMSVVDNAPANVTDAVLHLAAELVRAPAHAGRPVGVDRPVLRRASSAPAGRMYADGGQGTRGAQQARLALLPLVREYARRKRDLEAMDFGDQLARAATVASSTPRSARSSGTGTGSCCSTSTRTPATPR